MAGARHGGAELFFERLCLALHGAGLPTLAVIRHNAARGTRLRSGGLDVHELAFGGWSDLTTRPRLRRILLDWQPGVVVSWMNRAAGLTPSGPWVRVGRLGGYYPLRHYRGCDWLAGNTRGIADWIAAQGWPAARVACVPNFADDLAGAAPAALPPELDDGRPVLLGLGRLHPDKGFDTLLRALALLPGCVGLIAGSGPQDAALRRLAQDLGVTDRVAFLGWRTDTANLLARAQVFVCSSRVEPLGNMVLEAWSAARPVVAVAARGPAELLRPNEDGLLVPHEDPAALAAAIRTVLADPALAARLADAGRRRFAQEFAQTQAIAAWQAFLSRAASRTAAAPHASSTPATAAPPPAR